MPQSRIISIIEDRFLDKSAISKITLDIKLVKRACWVVEVDDATGSHFTVIYDSKVEI